ncbi:MAG: hypothetical protein HRU70_07845 [Phycisphaeraceae bacterium]|nr:MAG: hypothetical protein HRU70_07845 [Phycisphaeraceae bacterium]
MPRPNTILSIVGVLLAVPFVVLANAGGGGSNGRCWIETWFNSTCTGQCGVAYTICPGTVQCDHAAQGKKEYSILTKGPYPCQDYIGGTGTCWITTHCTGGTPTSPPTTTVIIWQQKCTESCG